MWQQGPFLKYLFVVAHLFWNDFVFASEESSTPQTPSEDLPPLFQDVSFEFWALVIWQLFKHMTALSVFNLKTFQHISKSLQKLCCNHKDSQIAKIIAHSFSNCHHKLMPFLISLIRRGAPINSKICLWKTCKKSPNNCLLYFLFVGNSGNGKMHFYPDDLLMSR